MEVGSQDVARTGLKGKGLKLLHVYGDQLWSLGGSKASPDPSFTPQRIFPLQACAHDGVPPCMPFGSWAFLCSPRLVEFPSTHLGSSAGCRRGECSRRCGGSSGQHGSAQCLW